MKKSLFTFLFSSLMVLMVFSSCANINRDDEKTQNEANVIISLGQTGARFSTPIEYDYINYDWKLEIKYADGTAITGTQLKGAETGENTATCKWVYKLEPAKYEITLTGTANTNNTANTGAKINLIAKKSITVTENQGPQNIVLVPHPDYDKGKNGKFGVLVSFIPKYEMLNMSASIKLVDYHDKTVVKEYGDDIVKVWSTNEINFSTDTQETEAKINYIDVLEGLYRIYIDVIYKNELEEIVDTQTIIDDSVDNLLEIVATPEGATSTLVTDYIVDLTDISSVVYYVVHNGEEKGNGISAAHPANLNDVLAKKYTNKNVRAINIYDVTTVSSGAAENGTATDLTESVPYIDVNLLQENIKYTFNLKINTDATTEPTYDYKYSLKRTSPTNFSLTLEYLSNHGALSTKEFDLLLRFENSSDKRMTIDVTSAPNSGIGIITTITPDLKGDVSLEIDYSILNTGSTTITIPDNIEDAQWQKYYTTKPYVVIKGIGSSDKFELPTINYNIDKTSYTISYEKEEYNVDESTNLKIAYYFDAYSADKIPLYSLPTNSSSKCEIAYASKSNPLEYRNIIVPGMEELIDLTIDQRNNDLYLFYTTTNSENEVTKYKITKMPLKNSSGYSSYSTYDISSKISSEIRKTPDLLKIGLNGNMFIRLKGEENSTSYYYKQCLGDDYHTVYGKRTEDDTSSFIASTITSDSAGNVYLVEGISSTETNTDEIRFSRISMIDYTTIEKEITLLKINNSSGTPEADELYNSLFDLFKIGEENGKPTYDFSDYKSLEFTDCYINGSYIYLTVRKACKNTSRGAVLKINIGYNIGVESVSTSLIDQVMPVFEVYDTYYKKFKEYKHSGDTFYGPTKIIAIKPDELIIVDEGIKDASDTPNLNRIVKLNLNKMSDLTVVSDILGSFEFSDYWGGGSFFYYY